MPTIFAVATVATITPTSGLPFTLLHAARSALFAVRHAFTLLSGTTAIGASLLYANAASLDANSLSRNILFDLALGGAAYRLGVHRKQLSEVSRFVSTELDRLRGEMRKGFATLGRRLNAIDAFLVAAAEQRVDAERWRGRAEVRLDGADRRLDVLDEALAEVRNDLRSEPRNDGRDELTNAGHASLRRDTVP